MQLFTPTINCKQSEVGDSDGNLGSNGEVVGFLEGMEFVGMRVGEVEGKGSEGEREGVAEGMGVEHRFSSQNESCSEQ